MKLIFFVFWISLLNPSAWAQTPPAVHLVIPPASEKLFIRIQQPTIDANWFNKKKLTAADDLVVEVQGKTCGEGVEKLAGRFHPSKMGRDASLDATYYTAEALEGENEYFLVKHLAAREDDQIAEVWLVRYDWKDSCYHQKSIGFRSDYPAGILSECNGGGCVGGFYISTDTSSLLKIVRRKTGTQFTTYSVKSLKKISSGFEPGKLAEKQSGDQTDLLFMGEEYQLFINWCREK